jgi:hypothetical protein
MAEETNRLPQGEFLRRRNALWQQLRALEPGNPKVEVLLLELMRLTHWPRAKILAGLGWNEPDSPAV